MCIYPPVTPWVHRWYNEGSRAAGGKPPKGLGTPPPETGSLENSTVTRRDQGLNGPPLDAFLARGNSRPHFGVAAKYLAKPGYTRDAFAVTLA